MSPLTIHALKSRRIVRELTIPVGGARHRTQHRLALELVIKGEGLIGRGEAAPLPDYSLDTFEEVEQAVAAFAARLPITVADLAAVEALCAPYPPAARAGLETALLDLVGQARSRPLCALLASGAVMTSLPLCAVLHDEDPAREAEALVKAGYRTLKRKIDGDPARLALLAGVRGARLRLDANRGLAPAQLEALLPTLRTLPLELFEEPIDGDLAASQPMLVGLPLALDESLAAHTADGALDALARHAPAIRDRRIGVVVVKPSRDGLFGARRIAEAARALGAAVVVTHLWDGPIAHLAAAHLALAVGALDVAQGLAPQPGWGAESSPARDVLESVLHNGVLRAPTGPGLCA